MRIRTVFSRRFLAPTTVNRGQRFGTRVSAGLGVGGCRPTGGLVEFPNQGSRLAPPTSRCGASPRCRCRDVERLGGGPDESNIRRERSKLVDLTSWQAAQPSCTLSRMTSLSRGRHRTGPPGRSTVNRATTLGFHRSWFGYRNIFRFWIEVEGTARLWMDLHNRQVRRDPRASRRVPLVGQNVAAHCHAAGPPPGMVVQ